MIDFRVIHIICAGSKKIGAGIIITTAKKEIVHLRSDFIFTPVNKIISGQDKKGQEHFFHFEEIINIESDFLKSVSSNKKEEVVEIEFLQRR